MNVESVFQSESFWSIKILKRPIRKFFFRNHVSSKVESAFSAEKLRVSSYSDFLPAIFEFLLLYFPETVLGSISEPDAL